MGGRRWTEEEKEYLRKNYRDGDISKIAAELGRSNEAVKLTAARLKLKKSNFWTEEELSYLKNNYTKMTCEKIGEKLNRSANAVHQKINDLNLPRKQENWTEDDLIYLEYFVYEGDEKLKEAAEFLGRTLGAVETMLKRLRKKSKNVCYINKKWTEKEDNFLRENYQTMSGKAIAIRFGCTYGAVKSRRSFLGLKRKRTKEKDGEIRKLLAEGYYLSQISKELGINLNTLRTHCINNGIAYRPMPKSEAAKNHYWRLLESIRCK
ncbi:hypothetical protein ACVR7L_000044 [Listeria monocytogenes]